MARRKSSKRSGTFRGSANGTYSWTCSIGSNPVTRVMDTSNRGFDTALVGTQKPELKPDISLLNDSVGDPFSPGNICGGGPVSPGVQPAGHGRPPAAEPEQ